MVKYYLNPGKEDKFRKKNDSALTLFGIRVKNGET